MKKTTGNILIGAVLLASIVTGVIVTAPAPRIIITQSGITYTCTDQPFAGMTITADNVTVIGPCYAQDAIGNGLVVDGNNNRVTDFNIDGVTGLSPTRNERDYSRVFGDGNTISGGTWTGLVCETPAHCDGVQTWGDSNHRAATNLLIENLVIENFCYYGIPGSTLSKCQGFMLESGSDPNNTAHHITIKNNVIHAYRGANIGSSGDAGTTNNIVFENNTFVGLAPRPITGTNTGEYGIFITRGSAITSTKNIFYDIDGVWSYGGITHTNNWIYRSDGGSISPAISGTNRGGNPLMGADYHLLANSPACGYGAFPCGVTVTPSLTASVTVTITPSKTPTRTPTPTAFCVPALSVWVCNRKP